MNNQEVCKKIEVLIGEEHHFDENGSKVPYLVSFYNETNKVLIDLRISRDHRVFSIDGDFDFAYFRNSLRRQLDTCQIEMKNDTTSNKKVSAAIYYPKTQE